MGAQILTIAQQKGGAGKTTIAAQLAVALAEHGLHVLAIDIDPQASLAQWFAIRQQTLGEENTGIDFLAVSGWRLGSEIARMKDAFDVIVVDSPPHLETEARTAIRQADLILIPVQPSPTDLWATHGTLALARAENKPVHTVLNRVNPQSRIYTKIREELPQLANSILCNRVAFATSIMDGLAVTETDPGSAAAAEVTLLAEELLRLLGYDVVELEDGEMAMREEA